MMNAEQAEEQQEARQVVGPDGEMMGIPHSMVLGVEKFRSPVKHFRLIWDWRGKAWLCEESRSRFRKKYGPGGVVEAGRKLAEELGVFFNEVTR